MNDLFHIHARDSIRTEFRVYEHNQSRIRRLYAFQARDFPHTFKEYIIIKEKRVSNAPIRSVECVRKVTRLECKFMNDLFHIHARDSIRTEFRVYEHNQSRIQRLYAFQARDFPYTFKATYRNVRYSLLFYYILFECVRKVTYS